jgi:hypothetical protein
MPEGRNLSAATLDDPRRYAPMAHVFTASAQPWDLVPEGVPRFERMPPAPSKSARSEPKASGARSD